MQLLFNNFELCRFWSRCTNGMRVWDGATEVVLQVAALPMLSVVRYFTTSGVLYSQPVSRAGYSNVHPRHLGRC